MVFTEWDLRIYIQKSVAVLKYILTKQAHII